MNHAQEYQEVDATEKSFKYYSDWLKNKTKKQTNRKPQNNQPKEKKKRKKTLSRDLL